MNDKHKLHERYGGTLIRGTLRRQDLIPAFLHELATRTSHEYAVKLAGFTPDNMPDEDSDLWDSDDAYELLDALFDELDRLAPAGHYFGAHPGDGSDFGYWLVEEIENV